jgi:hypothetical protein
MAQGELRTQFFRALLLSVDESSVTSNGAMIKDASIHSESIAFY